MTNITFCIRHHTWFLVRNRISSWVINPLYTAFSFVNYFCPLRQLLLSAMWYRYVFYPVHQLFMQHEVSCDWLYQPLRQVYFVQLITNRLSILQTHKWHLVHQTSNYSYKNTLLISNDFRSTMHIMNNFKQPIVASWLWYCISQPSTFRTDRILKRQDF
jgi:hypothetical protein